MRVSGMYDPHLTFPVKIKLCFQCAITFILIRVQTTVCGYCVGLYEAFTGCGGYSSEGVVNLDVVVSTKFSFS